jgi:phenylpyruvate tautomerase PptA (4-oxalocrotonate tautomerase family)
MPFIEVFALEGRVTNKPAAARSLTRALCNAFSIDASIVTVFFLDVPSVNFAHGGIVAPEGGTNTVFVKVHALRRAGDLRRRAAAELTHALCETNQINAPDIAIYFLEREEDECAHGGRLTSDLKPV